MSFKYLSINEEIGDKATHFFKTGSVLRKDDKSLVAIKNLIPKNGPNNTRVEYDLWYDMNDDQRVHGYLYTDAMSKFIYLRVGDAKRTYDIMRKASDERPTKEGYRILDELVNKSDDKYRLRKTNKEYPFVIFLPGANVMDRAVDWGKLKNAVSQGAKLKCHPLTSRDLYQLLCNKFGKDAILDKKLSGYDLMNAADIVGCAENSEMGIIALAKGKTVYRFGVYSNQLTYSAIYDALFQSGKGNVMRLASILSSKYCGLIPSCVDDPQEYIDSFFNYYKDIPHVKPKYTDN